MPGAIGEPWLPGVPRLQARWHGGALPHPPDLLVVHSGALGDNPAAYLAHASDGRKVSAHISATSRDGDFVQQLPLDAVGWHAGGSICQGLGGVNARSVGIELPAHEGPHLMGQYRELMQLLVQCCPSLEHWTCHRWIRRGKTDPVCWDDRRVRLAMDGVGLGECR